MWPSLDRYNSAIHKPDACFADAELRSGWPVRDKRGLPAPATGAFGCVYQMHTWDRSFAVKCFTREVLTSEWRYTEVSAYIEAHPSPYLVACDYIVPRGIMVDGRWYPVLKMDWVDGLTLDRFLDGRLEERALIDSLAAIWVKMMRALEERTMAHGDLQHGNVLICSDPDGISLKLVDYDGMFVPSFKGEEGSESGLVDYQHPKRTGRDFNERMDHFTSLVIYLSLRALALQPDLWGRYHSGENLIFKRKDFDQPQSSALFAELRRLPDASLVSLLERLAEACHNDDPCSLPSLYSLVTGEPELHSPAPRVEPAPAPAPAPVAPVAAEDTDTPVVCPTCHVRNRAIARYCRGCGLALPYTALEGPLPLTGIPAPAVRICPWCGMENDPDARCCAGCTALLE
jgi:hypothetical protein